jgi:AMIN domain
VPPLFRSDPEKNVRLWMQNCSLDGSLAREDAIREWLGRPLEARIQSVTNNRVESSESNASEMPGPVPQEVSDGANSDEKDLRNPKDWLGSNSQLIDGSKKKDPFVERVAFRTEHHSKLPLRLAKYSVFGLLIVTALWAIPARKVASRTDDPIAATQPSRAKPTAAVGVPVPHEAITTRSEFATGPMTIERLSVGCEDPQPCIEFSTRGKATLPELSTLGDPDRVVMDFQDTVFPSDVHRIAVGRGSVKAVRSAESATLSPHTRVVIDLTERCGYELQALPNRLVLKVYPEATSRQALSVLPVEGRK